MNETEFMQRWEAERPIHQVWGKYVVRTILEGLGTLIEPQPLDTFLKIWPNPRVKEVRSLIDKAFHRSKVYADPYGDITDKVGVRFVVLLTSDIKKVEKIILSCPDWEYSKDRDYEAERLQRPLEFDYQSVHYVVRTKHELDVEGIRIPAGVPCEIQVRTLLQHAHSELTHDNIYKPKTTAAPHVRRTVARSLALIEATDEFFQRVVADLEAAGRPARQALDILVGLYRTEVERVPEDAKSNLLLLDAFSTKLGEGFEQRVRSFLASKPYVKARIAERAANQHLFRQPVILFAYTMAGLAPSETKKLWPLTPDELRPIYTDLGLNFDGY